MACSITSGRSRTPGRPASINYRLTPAGRAQLGELNDYWKYINTTLNQMGR